MESYERRGGLQQRMAKAQAEEHKESGAAKFLVQEAVWGHIQMPFIQKLCALICEDVAAAAASKDKTFRYESLIKLAGIGTNGKYSCHMWTEFESLLTPSSFSCKSTFRCPMLRPNKKAFSYVDQPINDPHAMLSEIFNFYPEARSRSCISSLGRKSLCITYVRKIGLLLYRIRFFALSYIELFCL